MKNANSSTDIKLHQEAPRNEQMVRRNNVRASESSKYFEQQPSIKKLPNLIMKH